jgi:two-component system CheB/CheR fusion protein
VCAGALELRRRGERSEHAPVDLFFLTLAESCGAAGVGVILSGTGSDGAAGIRYIREAGGTTVAQSPEEAEYDGMPVSAIATGLIDLVLPSAQIPKELVRLRHHPAPRSGSAENGDFDAASRVFATVRIRTATISVCTSARRCCAGSNGCASKRHHIRILFVAECGSSETKRCCAIADIGEQLFRDPEAFEAFTAQMPAVFEGKCSADAVRVWVVGCATGEECTRSRWCWPVFRHTRGRSPPSALPQTSMKMGTRGRAGFWRSQCNGITPARLQRFF